MPVLALFRVAEKELVKRNIFKLLDCSSFGCMKTNKGKKQLCIHFVVVVVDCIVSGVDADTAISSLDPGVDDFGKKVDRSFGSNSDRAAELLSMSLDEYTFIALYMTKSSPKANIRPRRVLRRILIDLHEENDKTKEEETNIN